MQVANAAFFVPISQLNINQPELPRNMFQDPTFGGLNRVGDHLGEIAYAEVGSAGFSGGSVKSRPINFDLARLPAGVGFNLTSQGALYLASIVGGQGFVSYCEVSIGTIRVGSCHTFRRRAVMSHTCC
jgi:hypothetical protein